MQQTTRRVLCDCGRFLLRLDLPATPNRLELHRCECGRWPVIVIDCAGSVMLEFHGSRREQERRE
jgi:hypothetical protein